MAYAAAVAFPEDLMWTCHVCGRLRPDALIAVYKTRWRSLTGWEIRQNVRYCVDTPACVDGAADVKFLTGERWEALGVVEVEDEAAPARPGTPMADAEKPPGPSS